MGGEDENAPTQSELIAAVAQLNATVAALGQTVAQYTGLLEENTAYLKRKVRLLEQADRRRKLAIRLAFATIAADLVATSVGLVILDRQADTNHRIRQSLQQDYITQQQQAETRVKVLCPLYSLLLTAVANPRPEAVSTPALRAQFDASVKVIKDGYAALGCVPPLK